MSVSLLRTQPHTRLSLPSFTHPHSVLSTLTEELDGIVPFMQRYASELSYSKSHVANLSVQVSKVSGCFLCLHQA